MVRVAVQPVAMMRRRSPPAPALPASPFAFFAENDLLRLWLRALNAVLAAYGLAIVALLASQNAGCSGESASFYCDPRVGASRFALAMRNLHAVVAVYCGFCAWHLRFPRRCLVLLNLAVLALWGLALVALGISQCLVAAHAAASSSRDTTTTAVVGAELVLLGLLTTVGGGYGGWRYHKRRTIEMLVIVDVLRATQ